MVDVCNECVHVNVFPLGPDVQRPQNTPDTHTHICTQTSGKAFYTCSPEPRTHTCPQSVWNIEKALFSDCGKSSFISVSSTEDGHIGKKILLLLFFFFNIIVRQFSIYLKPIFIIHTKGIS